MLFLPRTPRPPLDACVEMLWLYSNRPRPHAFERILPTGTAQLIVNLQQDQTRSYDAEREMRCEAMAGTVLAGVRSRYSVIDTAEQEYVMGVVFRPGGLPSFLKAPAFEAADLDVPLEAVWGSRRVDALRDRLLAARGPEAKLDALEQALLETWRPMRPHPAVAFALGTFARRPHATSIAAVAEAVGLSSKRFIERFKSEVGLTPKRYCRILRFQRALTSAHRGRAIDWTDLALGCGYFDQAHFIHDFRAFSGLTPRTWEAARTEFQNHVKFLQSDAPSGPHHGVHDERDHISDRNSVSPRARR